MSHFSTLVLVPGDTPHDRIEAKVAELLAPYDENDKWLKDGSRWDWWQIGGRWTGALDPDYRAQDDAENIEICDLCGGSGLRMDSLGMETRRCDPSYSCNGCKGKGKGLKWPTQWKRHAKDMRPVRELSEAVLSKPTWALVTPDGKWREQGRTGWFALTIGEEREYADWQKAFRALVSEHSDAIAVIVDCHV